MEVGMYDAKAALRLETDGSDTFLENVLKRVTYADIELPVGFTEERTPSGRPLPPHVWFIIAHAAKVMDIDTTTLLTGREMGRRVSRRQHAVMYFIWHAETLDHKTIAELFGRSHRIVSFALQEVTKRFCGRDQETTLWLNELGEQFDVILPTA